MGAFTNFIKGGKSAPKVKAPPTYPGDPRPVVTNAMYSYAAGPSNLGVGVLNLALERPEIPLDFNFYAPRYDIKKSLGPLEGASQFPLVPSGTAIDLRANGVYLMGPGIQLNPLTASGGVNSATGTVQGAGNTQG